MKAKTVYEASDGKEFETAEAAREHEASLTLSCLENLTSEAIANAVAGKNLDVEEALKRAFAMIQARRKANGEVKPRKAAAAPLPSGSSAS